MHLQIYGSALRHGVDEQDIFHAVEHAMFAMQNDLEQWLYLGPDRSGNILEVATYEGTDGTEVVIHAMKIRKTYRRFLPGGERDDA